MAANALEDEHYLQFRKLSLIIWTDLRVLPSQHCMCAFYPWDRVTGNGSFQK